MDLALYEPGHGYYRRPDPGPGGGGDFLTAPETHPIFGAALGRLLERLGGARAGPTRSSYASTARGPARSPGGLLGGLRDVGLAAPRGDPVPAGRGRARAARRRSRARLDAAGLGDALGRRRAGGRRGPARSSRTRSSTRCPSTGYRPAATAASASCSSGWTTRAGSSRSRARPVDARARRAPRCRGVELADGQVTEICLARRQLARGVRLDSLDRGIVVLVDYAEEPATLHDPARRPTARCAAFARHAVGGDPFRHVGRQDLTATVGLAAVRAAAARAGLEPLGETTQAELLATRAPGDADRGVSCAATAPGSRTPCELRSALARLLDPRGMGGYRVLAFGRGLPRRRPARRPRPARSRPAR